jgi:phytoene dehydrogenase-like protein
VARTDAVVVGAGPNGLTAALTLARQGFRVTVLEAADEIGGGTRSSDQLTVPGVLHDICSAVHPMGVASPALRDLPLERHGLRWGHPPIAAAHPLDGGRAGFIHRELERTADGLGADGAAWRHVFAPAVDRFDALVGDVLGGMVKVPRHPLRTVRGGTVGALPATVLARAFRTDVGKALFGGVAAHAVAPLSQPLTSAIGLIIGAAGHLAGWPVAIGGSRAITDAMASYLRELGGEIHTGVRVTSLRDLPRSRVALFDVTPKQLAEIAGDAMPPRDRRRAERWQHGPAAYKVDYAVRGAVPWSAPDVAQAGTVHVVGSFDELVEAEALVHQDVLPERPFVLAAQQHVADPGRTITDEHGDTITPFWAYAHVPNGFDGDAALTRLEAQLERFAPGFGDRVVARHVTTPSQLEAYNANYLGGDIGGGATSFAQIVGRPKLSPDPYATAIPGVWLCSSSTPPGGGVHGLCGHNAATSALKVLTA